MSRTDDPRWVFLEELPGEIARGLFVDGAGRQPHQQVLLDAYQDGGRAELYLSAEEATRLRDRLDEILGGGLEVRLRALANEWELVGGTAGKLRADQLRRALEGHR